MQYFSICALIFIVSTASISAVQAKACCFPAQWEGGHTVYIADTDLYLRSRVAFDVTNKRMASKAVIRQGKHAVHMKAIIDWAAQKRYYIYKLKNKLVCRVHSIDKPLPPHANCLPASFRPLGSIRIGAGQASLKLTAYGLFSKNYKNVISVSEGCIPVRDSVFYNRHVGHMRVKKTYASASWYNITAGIHNASVFNVPAECHKSEPHNIVQHLLGMHVPEYLQSKFGANLFANVQQMEAKYQAHATRLLQNQVPHVEIHSIYNSMGDILQQAINHAKQLQGHLGLRKPGGPLFSQL